MLISEVGKSLKKKRKKKKLKQTTSGPYDQLLVSQMLQHKQSIKGLLDAETSQGEDAESHVQTGKARAGPYDQ